MRTFSPLAPFSERKLEKIIAKCTNSRAFKFGSESNLGLGGRLEADGGNRKLPSVLHHKLLQSTEAVIATAGACDLDVDELLGLPLPNFCNQLADGTSPKKPYQVWCRGQKPLAVWPFFWQPGRPHASRVELRILFHAQVLSRACWGGRG